MDRKELERDLCSQRKALLTPLFKLISVNGISTGDPRNFDEVPGVIMVIRTAGTITWDFTVAAKDCY